MILPKVVSSPTEVDSIVKDPLSVKDPAKT